MFIRNYWSKSCIQNLEKEWGDISFPHFLSFSFWNSKECKQLTGFKKSMKTVMSLHVNEWHLNFPLYKFEYLIDFMLENLV